MKHVAKKNRLSSLESAFIKVTLKQVIYLFSFLDKLIIHCSVMKIWSSYMNHRQLKFLLHGISLLFRGYKFSLRRRDKNERDKYKRDPEDKSFGDPSRCVSSEFRARTCILRAVSRCNRRASICLTIFLQRGYCTIIWKIVPGQKYNLIWKSSNMQTTSWMFEQWCQFLLLLF